MWSHHTLPSHALGISVILIAENAPRDRRGLSLLLVGLDNRFQEERSRMWGADERDVSDKAKSNVLLLDTADNNCSPDGRVCADRLDGIGGRCYRLVLISIGRVIK